jgi:chloramphenicol-sensitive protein RarD
LLVPLACFFVARSTGAGFNGTTYALLASSGVVTAVPLILFATAARRLTMATLGFMQFLSPSCQLLLAVAVFKEPFTRWHLASFALIWLALVLYCLEALRTYRRPVDPREDVTCAEA